VEGGSLPAVVSINLKPLKDEQVAGDGNPRPLRLTLSRLYEPIGIHVDKDQNIFVAESGGHRITKWVPNQGSSTRVAGTGNRSAKFTELYGPTSIILNDTGTMYITDMNNNRILRWTSNANQGECFLDCGRPGINNPGINKPVINPLNRPYDTTFDSKFNFLVVERYMHRVQRFNIHFVLQCSKYLFFASRKS
jgi:sugar lactone lactonase YvrE